MSVKPGANLDAEILIPAESNKSFIIYYIAWSYDDDPTGGRIVIREGGTDQFDVDITVGGPGFFPTIMRFAPNTEVQLVLYAGGAGISGKLNVMGFYEEPA
jgi:hypothetical protein